MKMKLLVTIILTTVLVTTISTAQVNKNSAFVSGLVGGAAVSNSEINSGNSIAITFGGSFGIPVAKNFFIYTRSSYSSKSNIHSYYNTSYITSQINFSDEFVKVNSSFSQLLINSGLLYNIYITDDITIGLSSGISFAVINQEAKLIGGHVISSLDNENIWGYFGGLSLEKYWGEEDITTFAEFQYNYANSDASYIISALNAVNFTFGVRYYLGSRSY
jgi:hypothetical protein